MKRRAHRLREVARAACLGVLLSLSLGSGVVQAQTNPAVEIGFGGAVVADAWNPLRVVVRNSQPAVLEISVDRGSLREGEIAYLYRAELPGGSGLITFTDDVFLPSWRSATWRLTTEDRLLASGSWSARDVDPRPLHLLVSSRPGMWRASYGDDARILDRNGPDLPTRASAYHGVTSILIDGSTAPPRAEALLAAAGRGATVILAGELPAGYADLDLLAPGTEQRYGNGRILRSDAADALAALARTSSVPGAVVHGALAERLDFEQPSGLPTGTILIAGIVYAVLVLLALRFGRLPGIAAALALAVVASFAAWNGLRPSETAFRADATAEISAGGIAYLDRITRLATLPARTMSVPYPATPLDRIAYRSEPDRATVDLVRGGASVLISPPSVTTPRLTWRGDRLENLASETAEDVWVLGWGPQGALGPGTELRPTENEDTVLPPIYEALAPHLPLGTALARMGPHVIVALPGSEPS